MDRSNELYNLGRTLMEAGDIAGAAVQFEESIRVWPHFKTLELLGECFIKLSRLQEAIVPLAASTALNRGPRAPSLLAEAFLELGELHDASEAAELALQRDPNNRRALAVRRAVFEQSPSPSD
jgi:tetratricopeptide (TPR) repeat protein